MAADESHDRFLLGQMSEALKGVARDIGEIKKQFATLPCQEHRERIATLEKGNGCPGDSGGRRKLRRPAVLITLGGGGAIGLVGIVELLKAIFERTIQP